MRQQVCAALAAVLLSGCFFGPGGVRIRSELMPVMPGMVPGEDQRLTIRDHNLLVPRWMQADSKRALDVMVRGAISPIQEREVAEDECRLYVGDAHPDNIVAVGTNGVLGAIAGLVGVGGGSQALSGHPDFVEFGLYGLAADGAGYIANALITIGGKQYTMNSCGEKAFKLFPEYGIETLGGSPW